ncbi:pentatricopeptide repeat-containing protein At3g29230-like [Asparagus officinalis]|uniref:pentatricopeptide repeat-containing protein At3g29230-like n=1 Tax=Asparagus officinalis TaxID=4686 RepID=UPI00098E7593|nr:pentatricopeptide repeat-containing protein At3g29230-like [Asparagus officinalis]
MSTTRIPRPSSLTIRNLSDKNPTKPHQQKQNPPPIINALVSFIHSPPHLSQVLAQFLTSGHHHDPFLAGHFIKHLAFSLPSPRLAASLFSLLPNPDAFISNTVIKSFLLNSQPEEALAFYRDSVANSSISPSNFTFPLLAKLFSHLGLAPNGMLLHAQIVKLGFEEDLYVRNSAIHMYACFGHLGSAWRLFEGFVEEADLVTWNSMIDGCVKNGMVEAARELFDEMRDKDLVSWNIMIAGYASVGMMEKARELFSIMPKWDVVTWNSMIDGYARDANVALARGFFDAMPKKSLVSWNVMLALYARVKGYKECCKLFDSMIAAGVVRPNGATFVSVLTACAKLGDLERGKWIHSLVKRIKGSDVLLLTSLLNMYAKCGAMDDAKEVFDQMSDRNVVTWNSMIMGYGLHGLSEKAIKLFFEMERSGIQPDDKTFTCILSACAHGGLVVEGWWFFEQMVRVYDLQPKVDHVGCMVDLLGRAGLLNDSEELAKQVKGKPSKALWGALMSASKTHCNWNLGEILGRKMIETEPRDVGPYVLLSNIYASEGRWDEAEQVREVMRENGVKKDVGVSLVDGRGLGFDDHKSSVGKKRIVDSMLSEMGAHLKMSYGGELGGRERSLQRVSRF